jgi:hypothetical protein
MNFRMRVSFNEMKITLFWVMKLCNPTEFVSKYGGENTISIFMVEETAEQ